MLRCFAYFAPTGNLICVWFREYSKLHNQKGQSIHLIGLFDYEEFNLVVLVLSVDCSVPIPEFAFPMLGSFYRVLPVQLKCYRVLN